MRPRTGTFAGIFLVALATLAYEILLTRIFSVTMWYHFAFVAISIAMFGMTVGALIVYLRPGLFPDEDLPRRLSAASLAFAVTAVVSLMIHLGMPFEAQRSLRGLLSLTVTYAVISVPFVFSGIAVSLVLTRYPLRVGSLYAADLVGAATGCLALIWALELTDGPTVAIMVAAAGCLAATAFLHGTDQTRQRRAAATGAIVLSALAAANTVLVHRQASLTPLVWVKGRVEPRPLWESWNSHSRIAVSGEPWELSEPFGWGLSATMPDHFRVQQMHLTIDASAATKIMRYEGDPAALEFLAYDIINLPHYLRRDADVLVVGVGGGRDLLSAIGFDQRRVVGVELNRNILRVITDVYPDYVGHLGDDPRVELVNDEARAYVSRQHSRFDVIQVSFIDTWAATAAGAYVLSENTLYTVDAWEEFLRSLKPTGVLSFSRWYDATAQGAMYRLTSLATAALARRGVEQPRQHIVVVARPPDADADVDGVGTIMVSPQPFSTDDLDTLESTASTLQFDVVLSPRFAADATFASLAESADRMRQASRDYPINIEPPTDESPFFFQLLRFRNIFEPETWAQGRMTRNQQAVYILGALLAIVLTVTSVFIVLPLLAGGIRRPDASAVPFLVFFGGIGLGFMLIEVSQMQRLNIFLGHPTYGLAVVLFTVLLASGAGSALTERLAPGHRRWLLVALLLVLLATAVVGPLLMTAFRGSSTPLRIVAAVVLLTPMGVAMGTPFPTGMARAARTHERLTPWFWGINGAASVCASVLAVVISLFSSITATYWVGVASYAVAASALVAAGRD